MTTTYFKADIHDHIKTIDDNSIEFIYTNPPFATTQQKWDKPLKWEQLFLEMWRVLKPNGTIIIHAAMPFSYKLMRYETPKYNYTWRKGNPTGHLLAKKQPLRNVEEIYVYYKSKPTYNPQMIGTEITKRTYKGQTQSGYYGERKEFSRTVERVGKYPKTDLGEFKRVIKGGKSVPEEIIRRMILTHSNENDKILDMTHHNQYVGDIAKELNRNYIGVDIQPEFY